MLVIREEQMTALSQVAQDSFEEEMITHSKALLPQLCSAIGDKQVRKAVESATSKATKYGFTQRGSVQLFIELSLFLGASFDTDPQYPWAKEILTEESEDQLERAEQLFEKMTEYFDSVMGPDDKNSLVALEKLTERLESIPKFKSDYFVDQVLQESKALFPEKANYVSDDTLKALIQKAISEARTYGINDGQGFALIYALMFSLGHGCTIDPVYPWIKRSLEDQIITAPLKRVENLKRKAVQWLERVLFWHKGE